MRRSRARSPLEHLVLETDSPYGAPQRYRGKRNEPAYVVEAAARVAELKGIAGRDGRGGDDAQRAAPASASAGRRRPREERTMKVASIYGPVQEDLRLVEDTLDRIKHVENFPALVEDARRTCSAAAASALRPAIALLAGQVRRLQHRPARAAGRVDRAAAHGDARARRRDRRIAIAPRPRDGERAVQQRRLGHARRLHVRPRRRADLAHRQHRRSCGCSRTRSWRSPAASCTRT